MTRVLRKRGGRRTQGAGVRRCPQASHLPQDHPRGRRAGSHRGDDTSRTSWRGGVLCSAPCKGRPPDASRPGPARVPAAAPDPAHPDHPEGPGAGSLAGARGRHHGGARSSTLTHSGLHHAPRRAFREPKWTPVEETAAWAPAPRAQPRARPALALPSPTPQDASAPRAGPPPLPAPPSRGPTRRRGPFQGNPDPGSCPGAGGGRHSPRRRAGGRWQDEDRSAEGLRHARLEGRQLGRRRGAQGAGAGAAVSGCRLASRPARQLTGGSHLPAPTE